MFFDNYPRFYETSLTSPFRGRLNLRYEAIFAENRDLLADARVLDIASHDGRWSLAALETGARSVVGVEARPELVDNAEANLAAYGISADRYRFVCGDVFDVLAKERIDVDVVLCLGFLYHTLRYNELLQRIRGINPRHVVIDTEVLAGRSKKPLVQIRNESAKSQKNAVSDEFSHGDKVLTGKPNVRGLRTMLGAYDFEFEGLSDWAGLLRDNPDADEVEDYAERARVTARFRSVAPAQP
jgi:predicted nicotinamide N-methyase